MKTVDSPVTEKFRDKGSKFIGCLFPAENREAFDERLGKIKSDHPDATHHCYAWRIGPHQIEEFVQDDGEPAGTAGTPILNRLKAYGLVNCGIVVVRYYGGTRLGKPGLIAAYGEAAERCIKKASFFDLTPTVEFRIRYPYDRQNEIDRLKNSYGLTELDSDYLEQVTLYLACRAQHADSFSAQLKKLEHLDIKAKKTGEGFLTEKG